MLYVLCRIGRDSYAVACESVECVLPMAALKTLPGAVAGVAGLLNFRGGPTPVVDFSLLLAGAPARELFDTRILLCRLPATPSGRLGLLAEGVSETIRLEESAFVPAGARAHGSLDGVAASEGILIQRIELPAILPPEILATLGIAMESAA